MMWHNARDGCITTSNFYAVCKTNISRPYLTLVKEITEPSSFKRAAIAKDEAKMVHIERSRKEHSEFTVFWAIFICVL